MSTVGGSMQPLWCRDVAFCLAAWVFPCATKYSYTVSFYTDIAFDLSKYGNATTLAYQWEYSAWWGSSKTAAGTELRIVSTVGDNVHRDSVLAGDHEQLFANGTGWNDEPLRHGGLLHLQQDSDRTMGHIRLAINMTFSRSVTDYINYYVKGALLNVTTPAISSSYLPSPTTLTSERPTNAASNSTSSSQIAASSGSSVPGSESSKLSTAAFAGGIVGAAILVALLIFIFLCYRARKKQRYTSQRPAVDESRSSRDSMEQNPHINPFEGEIRLELDANANNVPLIVVSEGNDSTRSQDGLTTPDVAGPSATNHRLSALYLPYVAGNPPAYMSSPFLPQQQPSTAELSDNETTQDEQEPDQSTEAIAGVSPGGRRTYTKQS
ncbi:hypothetical protein FRC17_002315 [Serendipita sp. 399]|nr:hypothetical protein FRC17_002315 [Serendipita sp. 399]